ncbi:hypothetical protein [Pontibacter sp. SGAir0037]|uniref:hypothetical protein n=1 Tax=Pontibacter sp. SGAir0037 TaxID=2571030 RepID=UPI0010CCFF10|nr:hypothetical protein [Pontibacter sp. SGAir0037]QCR20948.1 hypothetical protein C1N53_00260 [Pontibacter sp. SGAir0037]
MNALTTPAPLVEKEVIPSLHFNSEEVLTDPVARSKRMNDLSRATTLGNSYHGKVEITFQTADGERKRVATTIWTVEDKFITLKAGSSIPINAIVGVEFF